VSAVGFIIHNINIFQGGVEPPRRHPEHEVL
jgi:hypothetical protein